MDDQPEFRVAVLQARLLFAHLIGRGRGRGARLLSSLAWTWCRPGRMNSHSVQRAQGFGPVPRSGGTFWGRGLRCLILEPSRGRGLGGLPAASFLTHYLGVTFPRGGVEGDCRAPQLLPRPSLVRGCCRLTSSLTGQSQRE